MAPVPTPPNSDLALRQGIPAREYQELWFTLQRGHWRSVALVPTDVGASADGIANALGEVGRWLHENPTIFVMKDELDYASGAQLMARDGAGGGLSPNLGAGGQVIVAVQPVISVPLGLAIVEAADAVILCVDMGRTRVSAVRKTISLVGRSRIAGCFVRQ